MEYAFLFKTAFVLSVIYFALSGASFRRGSVWEPKVDFFAISTRMFTMIMPTFGLILIHSGWYAAVDQGLIVGAATDLTLSQQGAQLAFLIVITNVFGLVGFRLGMLGAELMLDTREK